MGDSDVADGAKLTETRERTPSNALSFAAERSASISLEQRKQAETGRRRRNTMKLSIAAAAALLLALSNAAPADTGNAPITATPDQFVVRGGQVFVSVVAVDTPVPKRSPH